MLLRASFKGHSELGCFLLYVWCSGWNELNMCFCTFPGEPDTELSAPAAIRQSGSDADHLPLPSLLPLLCGSPVDRCIHCLEVRGRDFKYLETAKYIQQFYEPQINCTFLFAKSCLPITESPKTGPLSRFCLLCPPPQADSLGAVWPVSWAQQHLQRGWRVDRWFKGVPRLSVGHLALWTRHQEWNLLFSRHTHDPVSPR